MPDAFKSYLKAERNYQVAALNPRYADDLPQDAELRRHLQTVSRWISSTGYYDRKAMAAAMNYFGSKYAAKGTIYRGTVGLHFDGAPSSYTKSRKVAETFAFNVASYGSKKDIFVIRRKAPRNSLDFRKLLRAYATCSIKHCDEAEVIAFNTPVPTGQLTEYTFVD